MLFKHARLSCNCALLAKPICDGCLNNLHYARHHVYNKYWSHDTYDYTCDQIAMHHIAYIGQPQG